MVTNHQCWYCRARSVDILLRLKAGGIPTAPRLGVSGLQFHRASPRFESSGMLVVCGGWDCWECQAPGTPILGHIRTPGVVYATGSPADFDGLGVTFVVLPSSRALHRFIVGTDRSPGWFRILPRYCGRTGRLRRTGRNPLRSNRFLHLSRAACHLNVSVGSSGQAYRRWSASLSDGAYPRPQKSEISDVRTRASLSLTP